MSYLCRIGIADPHDDRGHAHRGELEVHQSFLGQNVCWLGHNEKEVRIQSIGKQTEDT